MHAFLMLVDSDKEPSAVLYGEILTQYNTLYGTPVYVFKHSPPPSISKDLSEYFKGMFDDMFDKLLGHDQQSS